MSKDAASVLSSIHVFLCAFLCFQLCLHQFAVRKITRLQLSFAVLYFFLGAGIFTGGCTLSSVIHLPFYVRLFGLLSIYLIGPCFYFFFLSLKNPYFPLKFRMIIHFIPTAVLIIFTKPIFTDLLAVSLTIFYLLLITLNSFYYWSKRKFSGRTFRIILIFIIMLLTIFTVMISASLSGNLSLYYFGYIPVLFLLVYLGWISVRTPNFFIELSKELRKSEYEKKMESDYSEKKILARLNELMVIDLIFRQNDLTIGDVSSELNVASYELSNIINRHLEMNFPSYIRKYRLDYARELLLTEPEVKILSIAFSSGFNSKTSFNRSFQQAMGMTPREFQKKK